MNVLVLGGTRFLGRNIVETLATGGHAVTCFHRGTSPCRLPSGVRELFGNRDEPLPATLDQAWEAVVDVSGQQPAQVARSSELRTQRYAFVSTLNVYADLSRTGVTESDATIESFDPADAAMVYGANKAVCERIVRQRFADSATILRPGIIVGRWDYTGRFSYWPRRVLRGGRFVAPAPPQRPLQFVDARDVAAFVARIIGDGIGGTYNIAGPPAPFTLGELLDTCRVAATRLGAPAAEPVYLRGETLREHGVEPWVDLPMWLDDSQYAGLFSIDNARSVAAGCCYAPPFDTVNALMDWLGTPEGEAAPQPGLTPEREAALLSLV